VTETPVATHVKAEGFELDFEITADHLVDFLRVRQKLLNRAGGILAIGLIALGIYFIIGGDRPLGAFEILIGMFLLITSQTRLFDSWRVKRVGRAVIGTRAHIKVDASGIAVENAGMSSKVEWPAVTDLKLSEQIIIPMRGRMPACWMPTDAFESADARAAALAYMREQMARPRAEGATEP
jgi:hypothetical protein